MIVDHKLYSDEVEYSVLGGLFFYPETLIELGNLKPEDFFYGIHSEIFSKMVDVFNEKKTFSKSDFILWIQGKDTGTKDPVEYLEALMDSGALNRNSLIEHSEIVIEFSKKRKIDAIVRQISRDIHGKSSTEIMADISKSIAEGIGESKIKTSIEVMNEIRTSLDMPKEAFSTGIQAFDDALGGGIYQGYTYGLCGAEKSGKTTLAHTVSFNLKCPHLYVAMEMGSSQIHTRNISRELEVNSLRFLSHRDEMKERIKESKGNDNIFYLDLPGGNMEEILQNVTTAIVKHGIKGFIVDYWQLVEGQLNGESEEKHLRRVAQGFANYARKQGVWCILLAQMNKEGGLFGGNGLRKACDQLYMIEFADEDPQQRYRWLRMDASRYTPKNDVGSSDKPALILDFKSGPYMREL